jgi:tetratricopeptide (TPR) repeat protein
MRKSTLAFVLCAASALYACAAAPMQQTVAQTAPATPPQSAATDAILAKVTATSYQVRAGHFESVPETVALMQEATLNNPNDARLWAGMGMAWFLSVNAALAPGGKPAEGFAAFQKAADAHARALAIDPDNAEAMSGHGMAMIILSGFQRKPELLPLGIAEMNRAVAIAPGKATVRLQRAFSSVNTPGLAQRADAAIDDLGWLSRKAEGMRSGDYVRVMLGDVLFETGKSDLARKEYEAVSKSPRPAAEEARIRLAALASGAPVAPADIARLRSATSSNCVMCHGS